MNSLILAVLVSILLMLAHSAVTGIPEVGHCSNELLAMSPCLPYISSPPNNITSSASRECCDHFSSAFNTSIGATATAGCFCFLLFQPELLGFPVNTSRILSLWSFCAPKTGGSWRIKSLGSFCKGIVISPSPAQGMPPDSAAASPPTPGISSPELSPVPSSMPSMKSNSYQFLPKIMLLFAYSSAHLLSHTWY